MLHSQTPHSQLSVPPEYRSRTRTVDCGRVSTATQDANKWNNACGTPLLCMVPDATTPNGATQVDAQATVTYNPAAPDVFLTVAA